MIPERDPPWGLGREHGAAGADPEPCPDPEHQRRSVAGYEVGQCARVERVLAAGVARMRA